MATKIRGITIEIGGDTSGLQTSLRNVNKEINSTQSQLKDVEKLLRLDPGNVELLQQKQQLLARSITETTQKLDTLKEVQDEFVKSGGDVNSDSYMALQREIASTEIALDKATKEAQEFNEATGQAPSKLSAIGQAAQDVADKTEGVSKAAQGLLAGVAGLTGVAIKEFADFQQNMGGIETFFKDDADVVRQYAEEAYKTAGLSANAYMETITGFSAALLSSLGGNTRAAAELANIAIVDMADNANKFGTDISTIQNAYQGFAKQNYTMLDNLKLGFAGTKTGMEQLLAEAEKLTGTTFDINNFADIVTAIHEVQKSMGVAGTTAQEAEATISGSIATLKASVSNLALGFADADADVEHLTQETMTALQQVLNNILPVIQEILGSLPGWAKLGLGITAAVAVINPLATTIANISMLMTKLSPVISTVTTMMSGLSLSVGGVVAIVVAATAAIIKLSNALREWAAKKNGLDINTMPINSDYGVPGMASGGVLSRGSAFVGEAGPELLTLSNGQARVQPLTNNTTNNYYTAAAEGGYRPVDVTLLLDSATLARVMVQPNSRAVSLAGGSAIH